MNSQNQLIFDKMNSEAIKRIEEQETRTGYGILTVTAKYQIFKGKLTKDFICDISFKESIKLDLK